MISTLLSKVEESVLRNDSISILNFIMSKWPA